MLCLLAALALADLPASSATATTRPPASVPELFDFPEPGFPSSLTEIRKESTHTVFRLQFPSPVHSPDEQNNTVHAEYFQPQGGGRRPAVVVLHILGADFALSRYVATRLAERGVAALFLKLPYYGERRPVAEPGKRFLSADMDRSMLAMRQGVCDIRRALTWLSGRPEVDPERLGVCGISLGGILTALVTAVEPRVERAAVLLAGGNLATILWDMPEPEARRYRAQWLAAGRTRADLEAMTRPYDPLTYADRLRGRKLLMLAGSVDEVIPPRSVTELWEAAGRPPLVWFDCGHYSAVGYLLPAIRRTVGFFSEE